MPLIVLTSQSRWVRSVPTVHQLALETCAGVGARGQTSLSYPRNRGWWGSSALGSPALVQASLTLNKEQEEHKPVSHLQTPRLPGTKIVCQLIRNSLHKCQHLFLSISHLWRRYFDFSWLESQPQLELQPARSTSTTGRSPGTGEPPWWGWKGWIPNVSYKLKQGVAYCEIQNPHLSPFLGRFVGIYFSFPASELWAAGGSTLPRNIVAGWGKPGAGRQEDRRGFHPALLLQHWVMGTNHFSISLNTYLKLCRVDKHEMYLRTPAKKRA